MSEEENAWVVLSVNAIWCIFIYYIILLFLGLIVSIVAVLPAYNRIWISTILSDAIFGSLGISAVGSSIYYIRKMYKTCIQQNVCKPDSSELSKYREVGTKIYFTIRPIFALGFSVLAVVGLSSGLIAITLKSEELSRGFVFICMSLSFIFGFSSGKFITALEKKNQKLIPRLFSE